jgi:hypothetical protein
VVDTLHAKEEPQSLQRRSRGRPQNLEEEPFLHGLEDLEEEIEKELRLKLRKAGLSLIENKMQDSLLLRNWPEKPSKTEDFPDWAGTLEEVRWQGPSLESSRIQRKPRLRLWYNPHSKHQQAIDTLFSIVASGDLQDLEIVVGRSPKEALRGRDGEGNGLLHLAARLNKSAVFEWLLGCRGVASLFEKNGDGETPVSVAARLGHREVLKHVPRSLL